MIHSSNHAWRKSSRSGPNGDCVEVARLDQHRIGVRDSKDASGPILQFGLGAIAVLVADVKAGHLG